MDIRGCIYFEEGIRPWQIAEVPEWARAEHLERIIPLKELNGLKGSSSERRRLSAKFQLWLGGLLL